MKSRACFWHTLGLVGFKHQLPSFAPAYPKSQGFDRTCTSGVGRVWNWFQPPCSSLRNLFRQLIRLSVERQETGNLARFSKKLNSKIVRPTISKIFHMSQIFFKTSSFEKSDSPLVVSQCSRVRSTKRGVSFCPRLGSTLSFAVSKAGMYLWMNLFKGGRGG